jgi:hypothetical protein
VAKKIPGLAAKETGTIERFGVVSALHEEQAPPTERKGRIS